jgi:hypothetical protein
MTESEEGSLDPDVRTAAEKVLKRVLDKIVSRGRLSVEFPDRQAQDDLIGRLLHDDRVIVQVENAYREVLELRFRRTARPKPECPWWRLGIRPVAAFICMVLAAVAAVLPSLRQVAWPVDFLAVTFLVVDVVADTPPRLAGMEVVIQRVRQASMLVRLAICEAVEEIKARRMIRMKIAIPEVRKDINGRSSRFSIVLSIRDAAGLDVPVEKTSAISTEATKALQGALRNRNPGAVGIAGKNGLGKTTLIRRAIANEFTDGPKRFLSVEASAPVGEAPRVDALVCVLMLHEAACKEALKRLSPGGWGALVVRSVQALAGLVLLAALCVLALIVFRRPFGWDVLTWTHFPQVTGTWREWLLQVVHAAGSDLRFDIFLIVSCVLLAGLLIWLTRNILTSAGRALSVSARARRKNLEKRARDDLDRIRYPQRKRQRSRSMAVGKILAIKDGEEGQEGSIDAPTAVQRLCEFLEMFSEVFYDYGRILVAIDNLDAPDPEVIRDFLRVLKPVSQISHCVVLIALPESAFAEHEARIFDESRRMDGVRKMIQVKPFTLLESQLWMAGRTVGVTEPFICLCHCLSGGRPGDLHAVASALNDSYLRHVKSPTKKSGTDEGPTLAVITRDMIWKDIHRKAAAYSERVGGLRFAEDALKVRNQLDCLDGDRDVDLLRECEKFSKIAGTCAKMTELSWEVACYLYFCATLLEVFTDSLTQERIEAANTGCTAGRIEELARGQYLGSAGVQVSWTAVTKFRRAWQLTELPTPGGAD